MASIGRIMASESICADGIRWLALLVSYFSRFRASFTTPFGLSAKIRKKFICTFDKTRRGVFWSCTLHLSTLSINTHLYRKPWGSTGWSTPSNLSCELLWLDSICRLCIQGPMSLIEGLLAGNGVTCTMVLCCWFEKIGPMQEFGVVCFCFAKEIQWEFLASLCIW